MNGKRTLVWRILTTALSVALIAWIYSNSLKSADESTAQSGKVLYALRDVLAFLFPNGKVVVSMHFVRKAAHFCEYALLGFLLFYTLKSYGVKSLISGLCSFLGATLVAFSDEGLQFLSEGRAPAFLDVAIDSAGALCGALVAFAVLFIIEKIIEKRKKNKEKTV